MKEKKKPKVHFSNKVETLISHLQEDVLLSLRPFEKRMIVVADPVQRNFLMHAFAMDPKIGIAAGFSVVGLQEAIGSLCELAAVKYSIPSPLEISLKLEEEIGKILKENDKAFAELLSYFYLEQKNQGFQKALKDKVISFSNDLAYLFFLYGVYGKNFLLTWQQQPHWQQALWKRVFNSETGWSYPLSLLSAAAESPLPIHVFGFSFLPRIYVDFFCSHEATYYFLSPCEMFWEDLCSDKERIFLQKVLAGKKTQLKVQEQMHFYLNDYNPLLANLGKLGREFLKIMGEKELLLEEDYQSQDMPSSLLGCLQRDLLELKTTQDHGRMTFAEDDISIQVASATSKLREVEVLKNAIYELLVASQDSESPLTYKDVVVYAPNLSDYEPFIHTVFATSDCAIDYCIPLAESGKEEGFVSAFFHLLDLPQKRFSLDAVLGLFHFSCFQKKWDLSHDDLALITKWFNAASVLWGVDEEHRRDLLSSDHIEQSGSGTWEHAFTQLLYGLVFLFEEGNEPEPFPAAWPLASVECSDAELLGKVAYLIKSIYEDLLYFYEEKEKDLSFYLSFIRCMAESYFVIDEGGIHFLQEVDKVESRVCPLLRDKMSYASATRLLTSLNKKRGRSFQGSRLQAVQFLPLHLEKIVPAKVICLLGMQEGNFPRHQVISSLCDRDFLRGKDYIPSQTDEDRYFFLQAILLAKTHLYMSYVRVSSEDQKMVSYASVIQELFSYLDRFYQGKGGLLPSQTLCKDHPSLCFDHSYFALETKKRNFSLTSYREAKSYYVKEKTSPAALLDEVGDNSSQEEILIPLQDLEKFAKHPIRFTLQNTLGIYVPPIFAETDEEFSLSGRQKAHLRNTAIHSAVSPLLKRAEAQGKLPTGRFKELAVKKMHTELSFIKQHMQTFQVEEIVKVELVRTCRAPALSHGCLILPALQIEGANKQCYRIEGSLSSITEKGMVYPGEGEIKDYVTLWPLYLVYLSLPKTAFFKQRNLYLSKEGIVKPPLFDNAEEILTYYLEYFLFAKQAFSPLLPYTAEKFLTRKERECSKLLEEKGYAGLSPFPDNYLHWLTQRETAPSASEIFTRWEGLWSRCFSPMLEKWGKK